ncbi:MAG: DUF763 domain-containing protein [bacterium]
MKTGSADLPLHGGHCPSWLFDQMKDLGAAIVEVMLIEHSRREVLERLSDPGWFQAFGCVLGFDWHSSGLTTVVCGALKEALNPRADDLGLYFAGGKGKAGLNTPRDIEEFADKHSPNLPVDHLQYSSKMSAQVDSSALHDNHDIYHHSFILTQEGDWAVIQQGMNDATDQARRYHWLGSDDENFLDEPHEGICADHSLNPLDLTNPDSEKNRRLSTAIPVEKPRQTVNEYKKLLDFWDDEKHRLNLPDRHDVPQISHLEESIKKLYDRPIEDFEDVLDTPGIGKKTVRALSMISEVVWGVEPSYEDPARYSFAHGGKDGHPYPVDRERYRKTINTLHNCLDQSDVDHSKKLKALKRLSNLSDSIDLE